MRIGTLPDPESHPLWPGIRALLEAGARGRPLTLEPEHVIWIAIDGTQIIAAAQTRMLLDGGAELMNVGGTRVKEWFAEFENMICDWAAYEGADKIETRGRRGWRRMVEPLGWTVTGKHGDMLDYEKVLK